jgi:class 3 adenylate cyclase
MVCQACTAEIPSNARFCPQCGTPISTTSSTLTSASDRLQLIKEYIPPELASKIMDAGKKIESERRHVTVMFADVTGFTALSEQIDPEILSTLLNDCFKGLVSIVHKYEGTIDKFIGDAIMVIFGAPLAHENDPERAVRCALEMMEDIKRFNLISHINITTPVTLHIGLHSGIVVAGNVGSDLRMNYSVVGDTVNLASRLAHLAPPAEIFVSDSTYKLVSNLAVANGPYKVSVRGKSDPVVIYKLQSIKETFGHDTKRPVGKYFVGREKEIKLIEKLLEFSAKKQPLQLFIKGEAGVGKSHLKDEIYRRAVQKSISVIEGLCSSFEVNTPYYLWNTLLRSMFEIDFDVPEFEARSRLQHKLDLLNLRKEEPYVSAILGIRHDNLLNLEGSERKHKIFQSFSTLLKAYIARHRVVIILEDLHWIDKFSQELLYFLLSQDDHLPTLVIGLYRPEYTHARKVESYGNVLNLSRLSRDDTKSLMRLHLGADKIPEKVEEIILTRSEGNPFYLQEILKTLSEKNIIIVNQREVRLLNPDFEGEIPGTIQGIIMARIDSIQESIKSVLFSAAVIGREFSRPILEQVVDMNTDLDKKLNELKTLELILEKEEAREFDYLFKHYLIQEVAYNTILVNKRKELHASIAHAIEDLYPDRLQEFYEILAFHYEKAENWEKAAEYLGRSGNKAKQIYSKEESEDFFKRKDEALQKIYEAKGTQGSFLETFKNIIPPLIAMLIPLLPIYFYVLILGKNVQTAFTESIIIVIFASLLCIWYTLTLWFLGVVPFLRGQPKLYDLLENQVRIIFQDGSNLAIEFNEIGKVRFVNPTIKKSRSFFRKLIDPLCRVATNQKLTLLNWLKDVVFNVIPPYSFGLGSKKGEIHVQRKKGYRFLRLLFPWLNSPRKSKDISLFPHASWEFFEQFRVAFYTWKRQLSE